MTPSEKGCFRSLFCHAIYTRSRARGLGRKISTACDLRGEADDTPRHILRQWHACEEDRASLTPSVVREWSEKADDE
eukprot:7991682-Pyramimonas_sp.AAC.1